MNDRPTEPHADRQRQWKRSLLIAGLLLSVVGGVVYVLLPEYPLYRANRTPGREWSAWDAADHDVDGRLTREEMERFGSQAPHRDVDRLLQQFDEADTDHDRVVTQAEIDAYGTEIGSRDPRNRPQR